MNNLASTNANVFSVDENTFRLTCTRCGTYEFLSRFSYYKRAERRDEQITDCRDCYYRQGRNHSGTVTNTGCKPHKGELDDDLHPLDKKGQPYRPGQRICKKTDCVNLEHIVPTA